MSVKTMSILEFQRDRQQQFDCVNNLIIPNILENKNVFVTAPVKSGKRELVEIFSRITDKKNNDYIHYYVCNLNRKDCYDQICELESYGIKSILAKDLKDLKPILRTIEGLLNNRLKLIFHIDESDYGSANTQKLKDFLNVVYGKKNTHFIFYSATNEEVLFSNIKKDGVEASFTPDNNYCGYDFFLNHNLVQNATPFFEKNLSLSAQAETICSLHAQSDKQIGVVRLTTREKGESPFFTRFKKDYISHGKARKQLEDLYQKYGKKLKIEFVDQNNPFHWGTAETHPGTGFDHNILPPDYCLLVFIIQTSTRSTQWRCHNKIFFYHSYRNLSTPANTILQADARCVHYNTSGDIEDSKIKIFSDINVFLYYANRITADDLVKTGRKLSQRVSQSSSNRGRYKVKILREEDIKLQTKSNSFYFEWTDPDGFTRTINRFNSVRNTGSETNVRKDNLAYDILNNIYSLAESYENKNCAALIDGPRKTGNTDWTEDWKKLCDKYPFIENDINKGKKVFAVYYLDENKSISTNNSSAYQHL